jgi:hypothetical protein
LGWRENSWWEDDWINYENFWNFLFKSRGHRDWKKISGGRFFW